MNVLNEKRISSLVQVTSQLKGVDTELLFGLGDVPYTGRRSTRVRKSLCDDGSSLVASVSAFALASQTSESTLPVEVGHASG